MITFKSVEEGLGFSDIAEEERRCSIEWELHQGNFGRHILYSFDLMISID